MFTPSLSHCCRHSYPGTAQHWLGLTLGFVLTLLSASADVPVPERLYHPASAEEAWNVITLATANSQRLITEERLDEVASQIALCSAALRLLAKQGAELAQQAMIDEQTAKAFKLVNLIAKESMAGNQGGAENVFGEWQKTLEQLKQGFDPAVVNAEIHACATHPEVVSLLPDKACDFCGRPLKPRRVPYSFIYVKPSAKTLSVVTTLEAPLQAAQTSRLQVKLTPADGSPLAEADLLWTHDSPLHLLLVDASLQHFQHLLPMGSDKPGEFVFEITPTAEGPHLAWLGYVPTATALQEYQPLDLAGAATSAPEAEPQADGLMPVAVEGLKFQLSLPGLPHIKAGQTRLLRLEVTDAQGQPISQLEPVRKAFAHVTGIYEDRETVLELHPLGGDIEQAHLRGGPSLAFKFYPPKAGYLRIYCQVQVGGKPVLAAFRIHVRE